MSKWYLKSKTFWFGMLFILTGIANMFGYAQYSPSPEVQQIALVVIGIIVILLRWKTNRPVSIKKPFLDK